jgi:hypothetical protein
MAFLLARRSSREEQPLVSSACSGGRTLLLGSTARSFLVRSHKLDALWGSDDEDSASSFTSDAASDTSSLPLASEPSTTSAAAPAAAGATTPASSAATPPATPRSANLGGIVLAPAPLLPARKLPRPVVCDFREVSARLAGSATAQVDLEVRPRPHACATAARARARARACVIT